jgi:hypothetical protein
MKTPFLNRNAAGVSLGLFISAVFASHAIAGPGPQYWQQQDKIRAENAAKAKAPVAEPAKPAAAPTHLCAGATVVPVTAMKSLQSNGRPPLVAVQIGTKTVCHMCPVTTAVRTNSQANGRGTWTTTEVTKTGVEHTCTNCTAVATL